MCFLVRMRLRMVGIWLDPKGILVFEESRFAMRVPAFRPDCLITSLATVFRAMRLRSRGITTV